jgi:hypothetical protein
MHYAVLKLQAMRDRCRRFLPERWVVSPRSHAEGLYPRKASMAEMELSSDSPASSWVAWEITARQRRGGRRRSKEPSGSE